MMAIMRWLFSALSRDLGKLDGDFLLGHETLQTADRHRLIQTAAPALVLARVEAHAAQTDANGLRSRC